VRYCHLGCYVHAREEREEEEEEKGEERRVFGSRKSSRVLYYFSGNSQQPTASSGSGLPPTLKLTGDSLTQQFPPIVSLVQFIPHLLANTELHLLNKWLTPIGRKLPTIVTLHFSLGCIIASIAQNKHRVYIAMYTW
jgi:hypothetical protein